MIVTLKFKNTPIPFTINTFTKTCECGCERVVLYAMRSRSNNNEVNKGDVGYIIILDHDGKGNLNHVISEHRLIVEKHIGRKLLNHETIHHINGIKYDNRISNLEIVDKKAHVKELKGKQGITVNNFKSCLHFKTKKRK